MSSKLNPYINFKDNAREAVNFYQSVFGGTLTLGTFGEAGVPGSNPDGVMHAELITDNNMSIMVSDTPPGMQMSSTDGNVSLSLSGTDYAELRGYWEKLSDDASITVPLEKAPWGDVFGMLTDKFGVHWLVNITAQK
mgnify:FL=1